MKTLRLLLMGILVLETFVIPVAVLASDTSNALYGGTVRVTNNSTATSNVVVELEIGTQKMIDNFDLSGNLTDVALVNASGADVDFMPGYSDNWSFWVTSIAEDTSDDYRLYLKDVTGGKLRYFPGTGGMTVADNASIEADNSTVAVSGYINTTANGTNQYLFIKPGAVGAYVTANTTGNITASIFTETGVQQTAQDASYNLYTASTVHRAGQRFDSFAPNWITKVSFYLMKFGGPTGTANVTLRRVSDDAIIGTFGTLDVSTLGGAFAWKDFSTAVYNPQIQNVRISFEYTGGDAANYVIWGRRAADVGSGVQTIYNNGTGTWTDNASNDATYKYYIQVPDVSISATGVSSGEHDAEVEVGSLVWADGDILHFNGGASSEVNLGAIHNSTGNFTASVWFKLDSNWGTGSSDVTLLSKYLDANNYFQFYLYSRRVRAVLRIGGVSVVTLDSAIQGDPSFLANTWYHVTVSMVGNGAQKDWWMQLENQAPVTGVDATNANFPAGGTFWLASYAGSVANLIGNLANVAFFTDNLTLSERDGLRGNIHPSDVVNLYYIDEGTGNTIIDYGSGGNNGTRTVAGTAWEVDERPCTFVLRIDGVDEAYYVQPVSVPDNSNDWVFFGSDAVPYAEYAEITKDGAQTGYWEWEYASTFTDQSGNGNTATPTFPSGGSDPDVSAQLISLQPISQAHATTTALGWGSMLTSAPSQPSTMYTDNTSPGFFFATLVNTLLDFGNIPRGFFWTNFCFFIIIGAGIIAYRIHPSLLVKVGIMGALMIFFAAPGLNVYGQWVSLYFVLFVFGVLVTSRSYGL